MAISRSTKTLFLIGFLLVLAITGGCDSSNEGVTGAENQFAVDSNDGAITTYQTATPPASPDLRGNEFEVVLFLSNSDKFSSIVESIRRSVSDGADYFNSRGGVSGAIISLETITLPDDPEEMIDKVVRSLARQNPSLALMAAPIDKLLFDEINQQDIPFLYFGFGGTNFGNTDVENDKVFWLVPFPEDQLTKYFLLLWNDWENISPPGTFNELFIGYMEEEGLTNQQPIEDALSALDREGFEVQERTIVSPSPNASVSNFLVDSVQTQVTAIYSNSSSIGTSVLLNDLSSLALDQAFVVGGSFWSLDAGITELLLSEKSLEGYFLPLSTSWWTEAENPAIQVAREIFIAGNNLEDQKDLAYLVGLGAMDIVVEVLQRSVQDEAIFEIGGDDIHSHLEQLENYKVLEGLFSIDFTDGNRSPTEMRLWQYSDGKLKPIGD